MPPITPRMSYALRKLAGQKSVRALRNRFTEIELTHQAARVNGATVAIDGHFYPGIMQSSVGEVYNAGRPAVAFYRERFGGASIVQQSVAAAGGAAIPPKQYATFVIAAADSTEAGKANADAVCTGTDDHLTINTILATVTPSGFKRVLLLEGTFVVNGTITVPSNTALEGQGDATVIQVSSSFSTSGEVIVCEASASNIQLKNFRLDGNNRAHINTIRLSTSTNVTVEGVWMYDCIHWRGIQHYGGGSDLRVVNCRFDTCNPSQALIDLYASDSVTFRRLQVLGCRFVDVASSRIAINVEGDEAPASSILPLPDDMRLREVLVAGCMFDGAGRFFDADYASAIVVADNTIKCVGAGIRWNDCFDVSVVGNQITGASVGILGANSYYAEERGGSQLYSIVGNTVRNTGQCIAVVGPPAEEGEGTRATEDYRIFATIAGNTLVNGGAANIAVATAAHLAITGNAIIQTDDYGGTGTAGIEITQSWDLVISGNMFSGNQRGIWATESSHLLIVGNYVINSLRDGILLGGCEDVVIRDNFLVSAGTITPTPESGRIHWAHVTIETLGPDPQPSARITIEDNTCRGVQDTTLLFMTDATNVLIRNNDFYLGSTRVNGTFSESPTITVTDTIGVSNNATVTGEIRNNRIPDGLGSAKIQDLLRVGAVETAGIENEEEVVTGNVTINGNSSWIAVSANSINDPTDDLLTITGATANSIYIISPASGDTITVKATNFKLVNNADFVMDDPNDRIMLHYTGSVFVELSRSKNTAP